MKASHTSISIFILSAFLSVWADRQLPVRCLPVDTQKTVWTFIPEDTEEHGNAPLYRMYGDTLLTEVLDGRRQWYSFSADSCFYAGEESRLMKLVPSHPIPTSAFGHFLLGSVTEECDSGIYCKTYPLEENGTYESLLPINGELRNGEGISLRVKAVTEIRRNTWTPDSIREEEETVTAERRRTRWFCAGDTLPVALQTEERVFVNDSPVRESIGTYIISAEELTDKSARSDPEDVLEGLHAVLEGDHLLLDGEVPAGTVLQVSLSDIQGIPVMETSLTAEDGWTGTALSVPPLRTGRYVLSIGASGSVRRIFLTRD